MFKSSKTFGHEIGLSACFRQWRADSHCNKLHGYALSFHFEFRASRLDHRNWVIDFGGLKSLRTELEQAFDHKLLIAEDDPCRSHLVALASLGVANVRIVETVGCESFAKQAFDMGIRWLDREGHTPRVTLDHVTVKEHGANGATYYATVARPPVAYDASTGDHR